MNSYVLARLAGERRREVRAEFARSARGRPVLRALLARALRASGDRLFRLGVMLDGSVSSAGTMETIAR